MAFFDHLTDRLFTFGQSKNMSDANNVKTLLKAKLNTEYEISNVIQDDKEIASFLFTLGCFQGELITVISILSETYVINIKDARYSIDSELAKMIVLV